MIFRKFSILFFSILALIILPVFAADSSNLVSVKSPTVFLKSSLGSDTPATYTSFSGIVFEVVGEAGEFYQVEAFNSEKLWILKSAVAPYQGPQPPPIQLKGIVAPVEQPPTPSSSDNKSVELPPGVMESIVSPDITPITPSTNFITPTANLPHIPVDLKSAIPTEDATGPTLPIPTLNGTATPDISVALTATPGEGTANPTLKDKIAAFNTAESEQKTEIPEHLTIPSASVSLVPTPSFIKQLPVYEYQPSFDDSFMFPHRPYSKYPQLDVEGYYELKISGRDYSPKLGTISPTDNRWAIIQRDPVYLKLPYDVLVGSPKFDMRFKFNIDGKLADDLSVHYDIEQEPDFPGKYDVRVNFQKQELTFFHLDSEFQNGEFISYRKALNGVKYTNSDTNWSAIVAFGKQRSEPKKFESFGNGRKTYNVGQKSLLEDSVRVWVNNIEMRAGRDYVVNYFEGDVTFTDVKGLGDYIEIVYEFTNPIEDFIPVLSKKNFFGAQFLWKATPVADTVPRIAKGTETYELTPSSNQGLVGSMNIELKNSPIVLGSEILLLNGQTLRRNIDYVLRNRKGRISFLKRPLASGDSISVNYDYYVTQDYSDDLIANDKPGPYTLTNSNVLDGSVKIWIDQKPAKEIVDYTIDYDNGQIQFSYPVSYPSIITARYRAVVVDAINDPTKPAASPINFGVTYLDEYVKGQSEELTLQITSENITSTQDTFSLANNPIVEVDKLVMTINDVPAVSGDYRIVNAYTGTIALTTPNPSARISVSYKYRKSFQTTYVFVAPNESPNLYINNTTPGFIMRDLPVKYKGIRKIRVYDGFTDPELIENQDYTVNYGSDGNSIGITFYKVGDIPPVPGVTITRTSYPQPGNRITIVYDNPPGASPDAGDISQKQVGVTFGTQLNKNWRIDTELSAAENNFSKPRLQTEITLPGHGNTEPYLMGQRNIVENSETVYVDNVPLVKDQQYSMNYVNGTFRFINLTPLAQNTIRVRFSYINPTGNTVAGTGSGFKAATKLGTSFKDGRWSLKADVKTIDKDYLPLSPILDKKGTTSFGGAVEYKVNEQNFLAVDYRRRDEYVPPSDDRNNVYSHYDDVNVKGRVRLFDGIDVRQNVRYGTQFQDPLSSTATTNRYAIDTAGVNWDTGVEFGNPDARHVFSRGYSKSVEGYLDGFNRREVETDSLRWNGTFRFKNWYGLGTTSLSPAWEYSSSTTRQLNSATGESGFGRAGRKFLGINSLYQPFSFWDGQVNISTEEQIAEVNGVAGSPARVNNTHTETNFRPFYWINTFASYDNREEFSPLIGQKGKRSNDLKYRIGSFSPQGFLVSAGAPAWASAPFTNSNFTYDLSLSDSKENNDLKSITNQSQTVAYNGFAPVPGFVLNRISYTSQLTQTFDLAGTQTSSQNATNRRYRQLAGNLSYRPAIPILQWFAYNLSLEKRAENRSNETTATVGTSNRTLDNVPFESRVQSLSFDPGRIVFGIPGIFGINLGSLRTTVEEFLQESTSIQNIQYAVNDPTFGTIATSNTAQDLSTISYLKLDAGITPLDLFTLGGGAKFGKERYSRNLSQANTGLTYRAVTDINLKGGWAPWSFVGFNGEYTNSVLNQFRSPSLNLTTDQLTSEEIRNDSRLFTDFLYQRRDSVSLTGTLTPIGFISFKGGGEFTRIRDELTTTSTIQGALFTQRVGTLGTELRPFVGFSVGYDYSVRLTDDQAGNSNRGFSGRFTLNYLPIQTENFKVSLTYSRDDNWGRALNTLQQNETQRGTGDTIRTQIVDRNDTVELGTLSMNITIPFKGNPYLENLVITGEGYLKKITDQLDPERALTGAQQIGYQITGLVLKATINF